jgi:hypothetical protein
MENITELVQEIQLATDFQINKRILKEKIVGDLHMAHSGGLFNVTPELLAFVQTWPNDEMYLEDVYENPVKLDRREFLVTAQQHYQTVMNRWHNEYHKLKQIRKI